MHLREQVDHPVHRLRKKELNAEITEATRKLDGLQRFESELARAIEVLDDLLTCPTCNRRADARRDFKAMGQHFSCTCADCSMELIPFR